MNSWEHNYANLIYNIINYGEERDTRAGKTRSLFGKTLEVDLQFGFPLLEGRKMFYKPVLGEMAAFIRGPNNIEDFKKYGCNYWDAWGGKEELDAIGDVSKKTGHINVDYGNKWRNWNGADQLQNLVDTLRSNPTDRRMLISGWDPSNIGNLSLPCCHLLYQWYVRDGEHLDMIWYQRSVDTMVGLPSDVILAAIWNIMLANEVKLKPGKIVFMLGDTHIYENHMEGVNEYLARVENNDELFSYFDYDLFDGASLFDFVPSDISIHYPANKIEPIKFELNV